jgi:hypothetical protein
MAKNMIILSDGTDQAGQINFDQARTKALR